MGEDADAQEDARAEAEHEKYLKEWHRLSEAEAKQIENYEKAMLSLATVALTLSLSYWDKLVSGHDPRFLWLLPIIWGFFFLSGMVILFSYLVSHEQAREHRNKLTRGYNPDYRIHESKGFLRLKRFGIRWFGDSNPLGDMIRCLNYWSMNLFCAGAVLLIFFGIVNLSAERIRNDVGPQEPAQTQQSAPSVPPRR